MIKTLFLPHFLRTTWMETDRILDIAKAFSDEMRIRIVSILAPGKPMRYTVIMKELELDAASESSKFAYHMGILTDAGIAEKVDDSYRITQGGIKVFQSMVDVSEKWANLRYQDSLKRLKGQDVQKLIWSRSLLSVCPYWLFYSYFLWFVRSTKISIPMFAVGVALLSLGLYWTRKNVEDLWNPQWEKFLEACAIVLGKNGLITGLITTLTSLGLIFLAILGSFLGEGILTLGPIAYSTILGCFAALIVGIYLSMKLGLLWESVTYGIPVPDLSGSLRLGYRIVLTILATTGMIFIAYGAYIGWGGHIGGGIGVFGSTYGIWKDYRRYSVI